MITQTRVDTLVGWHIHHIVRLLGVIIEVEELPLVAVVVIPQFLEPEGFLAMCGAIEQVLECWRHVEVLVYHEGHAEVHVVDELEAFGAYRAHRVEHGDLVQVVAGIHRVPPSLWLLGQYREERAAEGGHRVRAKECVGGKREVVPVHDGRHEVRGADHGLAVLTPALRGLRARDEQRLCYARIIEVGAAVWKRNPVIRGIDHEGVLCKSKVLEQL